MKPRSQSSSENSEFQIDCRHFNGYKPCGKSDACNSKCSHKDIVQTRILLIHLGAMGAVVRSTSLLKAIKRKFPACHITWVTDAPMQQLLEGNPLIDRVMLNNSQSHLLLGNMSFDFAFVVDKSQTASALLNLAHVDITFGFVTDNYTGAVVPATSAANELWELGLDDHQKFFVNQKPETQLITEALELPYQRDSYLLHLTPDEEKLVLERKRSWTDTVIRQMPSVSNKRMPVIGINTGCGPLMPAKKLSVQFHRDIIKRLVDELSLPIVLLGGPEDTLRNQAIGAGLPVVQSPTNQGLRDGLVSTAACDVVLTGDSLGMHMAIALKKYIAAWFGPSCAQEIDLFERGVKIHSQAECSPCWKRSCQKPVMCYDQVNLDEVISAVKALVQQAVAEGLGFEPTAITDDSNSKGEPSYTDGLPG